MDEGGSIAGAMVSLVRDVEGPLLLAISVVCYLLALGLFAQGCLRLLRTSTEAAGPSGVGTALCFVVCAVLVSLPSWLVGGEMSLFGERTGDLGATLGYGGGREESADAMNELLQAVFVVVSLVGLIAVIRGLFVLRAAADGRGGASAGGAAVMIFGGLLAWHIVPVIGAVQSSLGIEVLRIS